MTANDLRVFVFFLFGTRWLTDRVCRESGWAGPAYQKEIRGVRVCAQEIRYPGVSGVWNGCLRRSFIYHDKDPGAYPPGPKEDAPISRGRTTASEKGGEGWRGQEAREFSDPREGVHCSWYPEPRQPRSPCHSKMRVVAREEGVPPVTASEWKDHPVAGEFQGGNGQSGAAIRR